MGIREYTCDEHWVMCEIAESLHRTPETIQTKKQSLSYINKMYIPMSIIVVMLAEKNGNDLDWQK